MELKYEVRQWTDKTTGVVKEFYVYYIEVSGVRIYMQPSDNTGRQLLNFYLKNNNKK